MGNSLVYRTLYPQKKEDSCTEMKLVNGKKKNYEFIVDFFYFIFDFKYFFCNFCFPFCYFCNFFSIACDSINIFIISCCISSLFSISLYFLKNIFFVWFCFLWKTALNNKIISFHMYILIWAIHLEMKTKNLKIPKNYPF